MTFLPTQYYLNLSAVSALPVASQKPSIPHQSVPVPATSAHYPFFPRRDPEVSTSVRHKRDPLPTKVTPQQPPSNQKAEHLTGEMYL